jgi:hypothetical protein
MVKDMRLDDFEKERETQNSVLVDEGLAGAKQESLFGTENVNVLDTALQALARMEEEGHLSLA